MPTYLAPGVYTNEIDASAIASSTGDMIPVFIGTAKKGPMNSPVFCTNAQQAIDAFGEPFPESYLMYSVLAFFEEGGSCWIMRVGVECELGQDQELDAICVDTSGLKGKGWGRLPVFSGIDYGRISLRQVNTANPVTFHAASLGSVEFNDADLSTTDGATDATLTLSGTYTGSIDDTFLVIITGQPTNGSVHGATYQVIRNSDNEVVATGTLADSNNDGTSSPVVVTSGISMTVVVTDGVLDVNDTFVFKAIPDNRTFEVSVEGGASNSYVMPSTTYTSLNSFIAAFNTLLSGEDYLMVSYTQEDGTLIPQLRTTSAGERIQIVGGQAFALEMGSTVYAYDIPRSYLLGTNDGPYNITTSNNRIRINVIGTSSTKTVDFTIPVGVGQTASSIALSVDAAGISAGTTYWDSFAMTVPGGTSHLVIVTSANNAYDTLHLQANYSNMKSLQFANELDIAFPYKRAYRGFDDNRLILPASGESDPSVPLSCEDDQFSEECASDSAYYESIVGFFVAKSPGTWINGYTVSLELFTNGVGNTAGRYQVTIKNPQGQVVDTISDVSFDPLATRYIGNVINAGSSIGGTNGNAFLSWEERPAYFGSDVRLPSQFNNKGITGGANGIPEDPEYSALLDAAIIGSPALSTGIYAFQNPESYDITLLATPGFSSGAVIGTALQMCEARGDVLYLVDPPFGLRYQQVVDWHNGMLYSDLSAAINSNYGSLYYTWLKIYDQFSRTEIWVPPSGHVAAVYSRTARNGEQWDAPAGFRRGVILTALDVEFPLSREENALLYGYGNAVNPIIKYPQQGIVVWGQRTLQRSDTALDRVNVRMLNIFMKKALSRSTRFFVFEPNDEILRAQVRASVESFMANIKARRGITAYKVVCDETNNTPDRIDRNELHVAIFYKPTTVAEFIVLNYVMLRTGGSFSAEEVLAAAGIVS